MPQGKNALLPITIISAGTMAGDLTSTVVPIQWEDNIAVQLVWTGTPTGTLAVQVSMDEVTWTAIPFDPVITQPAGSSGACFICLNQLASPFLRVIYTRSSGTGTLTAKACGKGL